MKGHSQVALPPTSQEAQAEVVVLPRRVRELVALALFIIAIGMLLTASCLGTYKAEVRKPVYNMEGEQIGYTVDYEKRLTPLGTILVVTGLVLLFASLGLYVAADCGPLGGGGRGDQEP